MDSKVNDRLSTLIEKFAVWVVGALVALVCYTYIGTQTKIEGLEKSVTFLYQDKVSKAELKEEMERLRVQNEVNKTDIISRIDLYFNHVTPLLTVKRKDQR